MVLVLVLIQAGRSQTSVGNVMGSEGWLSNMFSWEFAVGFVVLGLVLRFLLGSAISLLVIIGITIGWFFAFGPWAIATFIELLIGYSIVQSLSDALSKDE